VFDGRRWVYNTYKEWQKQFPFWSEPTVKRIVLHLEDMGLLLNGNYNRVGFDQTKWYSIDYDALEARGLELTSDEIVRPSDQIDPMDGIKLIPPIPESNAEINTRRSLPLSPSASRPTSAASTTQTSHHPDKQTSSAPPQSEGEATTTAGDKDKDGPLPVAPGFPKYDGKAVFERAWQAYPKRRGKREGKAAALKVFLRLPQKDHEAVVLAVGNYAVSHTATKEGGTYVKDMERWLRDWEEWTEPEEPPHTNGSANGRPVPQGTPRSPGYVRPTERPPRSRIERPDWLKPTQPSAEI
jgi:hypothetical protein